MSAETEVPYLDAKEIEQYEAKFDQKLTELQKADGFSQGEQPNVELLEIIF